MPKASAKKSKPKSKPAVPETRPETRTSEAEWTGGIPIRLTRRMKGGGTLKTHLVEYIDKTLQQELRNQEPLIEKIKKYDRQYKGIKKKKVFPHPSCSNIAVPRSRIDVDTVAVRLIDVVWGQVKLAVVQAMDELFIPFVHDIEDAIEWWQSEIAKLKERLFSPILQALKSGTGMVNGNWEVQKRTVFLYATPEEVKDPDIKTYKTGNGSYLKKKVVTDFEGPIWRGVSREDVVISSYADDFEKAELVGFRTYLTKNQVRLGVKRGDYYPEVEKNLKIADDFDDVKKERALSEGKAIEDGVEKPFEVWQLNVRYDVDEDDEEDDIILTWHPATKTIMRAIYNPIFSGFRTLEKVITMPTEYCFEGIGLCEQLEQVQEALDTVFNMRFDRLGMINFPPILTASDADLPEDMELAPGAHWRVDTPVEGALRVVDVGREYPETERMEMALNNYGNQIAGIGPANLGQPTAERPVARETFQLIQETNKNIKFKIENIRDFFARLLTKTIEMMAQYKPTYEYWVESEGRYEQKTINFPLEYLRDGIKIKLRASSEVMNQEVKREIAVVVFQMLKEYMTGMVGVAQMLVSPMPPDFKLVLFEVNRIGVYLLKEIIREFGLIEEDQLVLDLAKVMDVNKIMSTPEQPPGGGQPQGGGQAPQGAPPQQGMM